PELLVAPMVQPGTHRSVYLPKPSDGATWIDYWSGRESPGGQEIEVQAPLERIPVFVRSGAIIPMLPDNIDTLIPRSPEMSKDVIAIDDRRVMQIWPGQGRSLQTSEGISATITRSANGATLQLSSKSPRPIELRRMFAGAAGANWSLDANGHFARQSVQ